MQGLLDPADASLEFVRKRENLRPLAIYRIDNEFLLCYDGKWSCVCVVVSLLTCSFDAEFAFYVNKTGWLSRKEFRIHWQGSPTGFGKSFELSPGAHADFSIALNYPYVLAFEPTFIEIWHVETGETAQIIQGNNLRLLFADTPPSTTNSSTPQQSQQPQYMYPQHPHPNFNHPNYPYGVSAPQGYGNGRRRFRRMDMGCRISRSNRVMGR